MLVRYIVRINNDGIWGSDSFEESIAFFNTIKKSLLKGVFLENIDKVELQKEFWDTDSHRFSVITLACVVINR